MMNEVFSLSGIREPDLAYLLDMLDHEHFKMMRTMDLLTKINQPDTIYRNRLIFR